MDKKVQEALDYLRKVSHEVPSAMSLAWTILALDTYGCDYHKELGLLLDLQNEDGSFGMNYFVDSTFFVSP